MDILLTNDDGIYAEGIYALYSELKKTAKVTVVAPESQKSSVGHAITLSHPIWYKRVSRGGKPFGYGVSGTPADCVKFGIKIILKKRPDLVISGINSGPNDGCSVFYSGTCAGAREGALCGVPSIAMSLNSFVSTDFNYAAEFGSRIVKFVLKHRLPKGRFLNVNVPSLPKSKIKGVKYTEQCKVPIHGDFNKRKDPNLKNYYWMTGVAPKKKNDLSIDTYALGSNYITITPIQCDSTDYELLEGMKKWKI